ncbi:uncharacterized protein A4U43_UnF1550 [Asparagus officinalis]|uniref:glutathione transferase n=1 Tax=Asparagus officinalis TaxID=4686 RepID=A0A1R3L7H7_ASPOF|nr:glutathione S-transferase 3-like [Asparagus officinalis]ONK55572.1 uncharacterized protein A4U43_UnF1550 [Asparagus officinalis]
MGLKVYGVTLSPNVLRVVAALNEKGLDFELVPVDLAAGAHKKPEFLALNPFGQVPAFEDGDVRVFDSRAINRYIATQYKQTGLDLIPSKTPTVLAAVESWAEAEAQQFSPVASKLLFEIIFKPMFGLGATDPAAVDSLSADLGKVLDVYEAHLSKSKYFAGDEFSLADLNHMPAFSALMTTPKGELIAARPHVKAWWGPGSEVVF